jgi:multimeric flavodoxin WrbA
MKTLLLASFIMTGTTAAYAGNHSVSFPKSDCNEMFMGVVELLEEADKEWAFLQDNPKDSSDAVEHAQKIQWLVGLAANHTKIHEAFCDKS